MTTMMKVCPVCGLELPQMYVSRPPDHVDVNCNNCGQFSLEGAVLTDLARASLWERRLLAYTILTHSIALVTQQIIADVRKNGRFPPPIEQQDNLVRWLGRELASSPGDVAVLNFNTLQARIGLQDEKTFDYVCRMANRAGFLDDSLNSSSDNPDETPARLSLGGWIRYGELTKAPILSKNAFMAMRFENEDLARIIATHFRPAVAATGLDLKRLDDEETAGLIDERLRVKIRTSRVLIADLTDDNAGAYWEAGFAEGLGIPVIYLCKEDVFKSRGTHFDTNHLTTVLWDAESPEKAAERLTAIIRNTLPGVVRMIDEQ